MNTIAMVANTDAFWSSSIGSMLQNILVAFGILIVVGAVIKAVPKFFDGKAGAGVKIIIGAVFLAAICFRPDIIGQLITSAGNLISTGSGSVDQIANGGASSTAR